MRVFEKERMLVMMGRLCGMAEVSLISVRMLCAIFSATIPDAFFQLAFNPLSSVFLFHAHPAG
jgi:hypothetical protein